MALSPNFLGTPLSGLAPLSVAFTDLTTDGTPVSWLWDFGDGTTSTSQNPTHVYLTPGLKTVSLTVTDGSTTTTTTSAPIYIGFGWDSSSDPSYVDYSYFQSSKQPVRFEDRSPGVITQRDWTFGFNYPIGSMYAAVASPRSHHFIGNITSDKPQYMAYHDGDWTLSTNFSLYSDTTEFYSDAQMVYHDGMYVLCNNNKIWTSPDFYTWTKRLQIPGATANFRALTWGNSEFVAVGYSDASTYHGSLSAKSSDGTTWSYIIGNVSNRSFNGRGLVWDGTNYYAAQQQYLMRSSNGTAWSLIYDIGYSFSYYDGIFANGRYLFSGPGSEMVTSTNGTSWSSYRIDPVPYSGNYFRLHFVDGTVIGLHSDNTSYKKFLYSHDTENWLFSGPENNFNAGNPSMEYGPLASPNKTYMCATYEGVNNKMYTSPDTVTWTERYSFLSESYQVCTTVSNNLFVVCSQGLIRTSSNGITWTDQTNLPTILRCATWSNDLDRFVVAGHGSYTYASSDGTTWTQYSLPRSIFSYLNSVTYGNGRFVLAGWDGIFTSTDGYTWVDTSAAPYSNYIVKFLNGNFYLGGTSPTKVSVDGSNWSDLPLVGPIDSFTYGYGKVLASKGLAIFTSSDNTTWEVASDSYLVGDGLAFAYGNEFVMINQDTYAQPCVAHAPTGANGWDWTVTNLHLPKVEGNWVQLHDISWDGTTYAICGSGNYVGLGSNTVNQTSTNGIDWTSSPVFPVTSQEEFPIVTFPDLGDYTVNLTIETDTSNIYSLSKPLHLINMNNGFSWDDTLGNHYNQNPFDLRYQPIRFWAADNKGDHTWNFGDGTVGYGTPVTHSYVIPLGDSSYMNRYRVDHTFNYQLNTLNSSRDLTTSAPYVAKFTGAPDGTSIIFTDISLYNPTSWDWTFGDGNYSILQNPTHAYAAPDTDYTVTLAVNTSVGRDSTTGVVRTANAGTVTFTRPDYSPGTVDVVSPALTIARGADDNGIYNALFQSGFTGNPTDTEWSLHGSAQPDPTVLTYGTWFSVLDNGEEYIPSWVVGNYMYLHIISEDTYYSFQFTYWGDPAGWGGGAGFSYTRILLS